MTRSFRSFFTRIRELLARPEVVLFLAGVMLLGINDGIIQISLNNYLVDLFEVRAVSRGALEFPRELPGFLTFFIISLLVYVRESRLSVLICLCIAVGTAGLGVLAISGVPTSFVMMLAFMFLWSLGMHLFMPISSSLTIYLTRSRAGGTRLGQVRSLRDFSFLIGALLVWTMMGPLNLGYSHLYLWSTVLVLAASVCFWKLNLAAAPRPDRIRWVYHRRYSLFYLLNLFFGIRKQMFLTFAPLVLILYYGLKPSHFAILMLISASIGTFFGTAVGKLVDLLGERFVLVSDSVLLFTVSICYSLVTRESVGTGPALYILCGCYVLDHVLFSARVAHVTYLKKILLEPGHLTPTLALGTTIDHLFAMTMPLAGGLLWHFVNYQAVFLPVAGLAVVMGVASCFTTGRHFASRQETSPAA